MMEYGRNLDTNEVTVYVRNEFGVFSIATIGDVYTEEQALCIAEEIYYEWENNR